MKNKITNIKFLFPNYQIKYTRHAKRRMKWRKTLEEEIKLTLAMPDKIEETGNRQNAFKKIKKKFIKVSYVIEQNTIIIISAVNKSD